MPKLAVLGQPISHSRSPAMHTAALEEMGLTGEWSYEAIEVAPDEFEARARALAGEGFAGVNVTVPHKLRALAIATDASEAARAIGAANTLSFADDGITADNTDATGIIQALPRRPEGLRALVLGAGGSARAAVWALCEAGARVSIWNRTASRAAELGRAFDAEAIGPAAGGTLPLARFDLLLNATTVGLEAAGSSPARGGEAGSGGELSDLKRLHLDADGLHASHVVVDLVYGTAETPLAAAARSRGAEVVDGLVVLAHQGAASLRLWTGVEPPIETMKQAARER